MSHRSNNFNSRPLPFNGKDWSTWKFQFTALLKARDLWTAVNCDDYEAWRRETNFHGIKLEGEEKSHEDQLKAMYKSCKSQAFALILLAMPTECVKYVQNVEEDNAKQIWQTLMEKFERTSTAGKVRLKVELYSLRLEEGGDFDTFKCHIEDYERRLAGMEVKLDATDKLAVLLGGLPPSFQMIATTSIIWITMVLFVN